MQISDRVTVGGWIAFLAGVIAFGLAAGIAIWSPGELGDPLSDRKKSADEIAIGSVTDTRQRVIADARAYLEIRNPDGQVLSKIPLRIDKGWFAIQADMIPAFAAGHGTRVSAEADGHLSTSVEIAVTSVTAANGAATVTIRPTPIHLRLQAVNPWATLVVLIPALYGLILALLHLTSLTRGLKVTHLYAVGMATLWGVVSAVLVVLYAREGNALIALFWPDLFVSAGVVVFAVLGSMVYVAYSLEEKDREVLFEGTAQQKQRILQVIGGRVVAAPYVALAGYTIFAATFPNLNSGAFASFFGFFAGLWIKPVLQVLNDIGMRLLSREQQDKVVANATAEKGPPPPVGSVDSLPPPSPAYFAAVAQAREELLRLDGVIAVEEGVKVVDGRATGQPAIVVYVYQKDPAMGPRDSNRIPDLVAGYRTDVVELPPPVLGSDDCRPAVFNVSWGKLNADHQSRRASPPQATAATIQNGVVVLTGRDSFFEIRSHRVEFDIVQAWTEARTVVDDHFDFFAFIIDWQSLGHGYFLSNYCVPVYNNVAGINHFKGTPFNDRATFRTNALLACQVISAPVTAWAALHELGHTWCAYVTNRGAGGIASDLLAVQDRGPADPQGRYHWGSQFDDGRSCMDYDRREWSETPQGFVRRRLLDTEFTYCDLDLYLMGLLAPDRVGDLTVLRNVTEIPSLPGTFSATKERVTIEDVIAASGQRPTSNAGREFRQGFAVISADPASGNAMASTVAQFLPTYETHFARATSGLATLKTTL